MAAFLWADLVLDVKGGTIQSARIGLTGATTHAVRLTKLEQALAGAAKDSVEKITANAGAELQMVNSDIHASVAYRRHLAGVLVSRVLLEAYDAARSVQ